MVVTRRSRRSGLEIKVEILKACCKPNLATRIMYASNIAYMPLKTHLKDLCEKGLLEFQVQKATKRRRLDLRCVGSYVITEKGLDVLEGFERVREALVE